MTRAGLLCKIVLFLPNLLQAVSPGFTDFQMLLNYQRHDCLRFVLRKAPHLGFLLCFSPLLWFFAVDPQETVPGGQ